jgi:hypothetical protein
VHKRHVATPCFHRKKYMKFAKSIFFFRHFFVLRVQFLPDFFANMTTTPSQTPKIPAFITVQWLDTGAAQLQKDAQHPPCTGYMVKLQSFRLCVHDQNDGTKKKEWALFREQARSITFPTGVKLTQPPRGFGLDDDISGGASMYTMNTTSLSEALKAASFDRPFPVSQPLTLPCNASKPKESDPIPSMPRNVSGQAFANLRRASSNPATTFLGTTSNSFAPPPTSVEFAPHASHRRKRDSDEHDDANEKPAKRFALQTGNHNRNYITEYDLQRIERNENIEDEFNPSFWQLFVRFIPPRPKRMVIRCVSSSGDTSDDHRLMARYAPSSGSASSTETESDDDMQGGCSSDDDSRGIVGRIADEQDTESEYQGVPTRVLASAPSRSSQKFGDDAAASILAAMPTSPPNGSVETSPVLGAKVASVSPPKIAVASSDAPRAGNKPEVIPTMANVFVPRAGGKHEVAPTMARVYPPITVEEYIAKLRAADDNSEQDGEGEEPSSTADEYSPRHSVGADEMPSVPQHIYIVANLLLNNFKTKPHLLVSQVEERTLVRYGENGIYRLLRMLKNGQAGVKALQQFIEERLAFVRNGENPVMDALAHAVRSRTTDSDSQLACTVKKILHRPVSAEEVGTAFYNIGLVRVDRLRKLLMGNVRAMVGDAVFEQVSRQV